MAADFDLSGLDKLTADLLMAGVTVVPFVNKAIQVTSRNVKDDWNKNLYRAGHAKRTGYSITYDVTLRAGEVSSEIGAVRGSGRQAYITRLLEFGSAHNAPHGAGAGALQKNQDDFVKGIDIAVSDALKVHGL
jgi:hypothetical protein